MESVVLNATSSLGLAWPSVTRATEDVAHIARMFLDWQLLCFVSSLWTYCVARHLPAGPYRSLACLPVVVMLLGATPFLIDRCRLPLVIIPLMAICSISAFKVLALAFGRGPLAQQHCEWHNCLKKFHIVLSFPIIPAAALKRCGSSAGCSAVSKASDATASIARCSVFGNSNNNYSDCLAGHSNNATAIAHPTAMPGHLTATAWKDACAGLAPESDPHSVKHIAASIIHSCLQPFCSKAQQSNRSTTVQADRLNSNVCRKENSNSSDSTSSANSKYAASISVPTSPTDLASYLQAAAWQVGFLALSVHITQHWTLVPLVFRHWFYALLLALELQLVWDFYGLLSAVWFDVPAAQSFDRPWESTSIADYWSKRWNVPVTYMIRVMVYDPIMEGRLVAAPSQPVKAAVADAAAELAGHSSMNSSPCSTGAGLEQAAGAVTAEGERVGMTRTCSGGSAGSVGSSSNDLCSLVAESNSELTKESNSELTKEFGQSNSSSSPSTVASLGLQESMLLSMPTFTAYKPAELAALTAAAEAAAGGSGGGVDSTQARSRKPSQLRRFLGVQASFVFSGTWHTLIFFYATGLWTPLWFWFFSLQAPAMAVEQVIQKLCKRRGVQLPTAAAAALTNLIILMFGSTMFCRPIDESGLNQAFYDNIMGRIATSEWQTSCKGPAYYW